MSAHPSEYSGMVPESSIVATALNNFGRKNGKTTEGVTPKGRQGLSSMRTKIWSNQIVGCSLVAKAKA